MTVRPPSNTDASKGPCLRLKNSTQAMTYLEIKYFQVDIFEQALADTVAQAPGFFQQTPVVLDIVSECQNIVVHSVVELCKKYSIHPIAIRSSDIQVQQQAQAIDLAILPPKRNSKKADSEQQDIIQPKPVPRKDTIITRAVRSGQRIYAADGDLIIMASVSAGAEVLADGNIHIYGTLRGRALAGVKGDQSARIFCQCHEAELLSVAGTFIVDEDLNKYCWKQPAHIFYNNALLSIEPL